MPLLRARAGVDAQAAKRSVRTPATVVAAVQHVSARECIKPALPRFHARNPKIEPDMRDSKRNEDFNSSGVDVFLAMGWPQCVWASFLPLRAGSGASSSAGADAAAAGAGMASILFSRM